MDKYKVILIIFLFGCQIVTAQKKHFVMEYNNVVDSISLYINSNKNEKKSAIGFISRTQKKRKEARIYIDTCIFYNIISKEPKHSFQNKVSLGRFITHLVLQLFYFLILILSADLLYANAT